MFEKNLIFQSFREFVVEKIRKLPGDYPIFNDFIMKECEILHQLLTEVRHTLTVSFETIGIPILNYFVPQ